MRGHHPSRPRAHLGSGLAQFAVVLPLLVGLALALMQFAFIIHAQQVLDAAAQDGARRAAAFDGTPEQGIATAQEILAAGLGPSSAAFTVTVTGDRGTISLGIAGPFKLFVPWTNQGAVTIRAEALTEKEAWHGTPR
jgi:Flp pilus assembly protein TadG